MKQFFLSMFLSLMLSTVFAQVKHQPKAPAIVLGSFEDDYQIHYKISDTLWVQLPTTKFHIIRWNKERQYLIAKNDEHNPGEAGLYTRIDYMEFTNMAPWKWGYCLTTYNAATDAIAEATAAADREHPMKGCNGFPFSRMKAVQLKSEKLCRLCDILAYSVVII